MRDPVFEAPHKKDYSILVSIWGFPYLGKLAYALDYKIHQTQPQMKTTLRMSCEYIWIVCNYCKWQDSQQKKL